MESREDHCRNALHGGLEPPFFSVSGEDRAELTA